MCRGSPLVRDGEVQRRGRGRSTVALEGERAKDDVGRWMEVTILSLVWERSSEITIEIIETGDGGAGTRRQRQRQRRGRWDLHRQRRRKRDALAIGGGEDGEGEGIAQVKPEESQSLSQHLPPLTPDSNFCFYEQFILRGIQVDRVEPGLVVYTFRVPPRFTNRTGKLARGSIANLVDELGGAAAHTEGFPMNFSVDMSISCLSTAHVNDELEITSRLLGRKGGYSGTIVTLRNKATGELIAEGRHSLFGRHASKM